MLSKILKVLCTIRKITKFYSPSITLQFCFSPGQAPNSSLLFNLDDDNAGSGGMMPKNPYISIIPFKFPTRQAWSLSLSKYFHFPKLILSTILWRLLRWPKEWGECHGRHSTRGFPIQIREVTWQLKRRCDADSWTWLQMGQFWHPLPWRWYGLQILFYMTYHVK